MRARVLVFSAFCAKRQKFFADDLSVGDATMLKDLGVEGAIRLLEPYVSTATMAEMRREKFSGRTLCELETVEDVMDTLAITKRAKAKELLGLIQQWKSSSSLPVAAVQTMERVLSKPPLPPKKKKPPPPPPPKKKSSSPDAATEPPKNLTTTPMPSLAARIAKLQKAQSESNVTKLDAKSELSALDYDFQAKLTTIQTKLGFIGGPFARPPPPPPPKKRHVMEIWPPCSYEVELRNHTTNVRLEGDDYGRIDCNRVPDGCYDVTITAKGLELPFAEGSTRRIQVQDGAVKGAKRFILDAAPLMIAFGDADDLIGPGRPVRATFVSEKNREKKFTLRGTTDDQGVGNFVLPRGTVLDVRAGLAGGREMKRTDPIEVYPDTANLVSILENATTCGPALGWMFDDESRAVILGDVSYSMDGNRLEILRRSMTDFLDAHVGRVALAAFDDFVDWCSTPWISSSEEDSGAAKDWITHLDARAGTNIRRAIEDALRLFPDATDVFILGDGDVTPFLCDDGTTVTRPDDDPRFFPDTNWSAYRRRFPNTRFHFIAFGKDADRQRMQQMTALGGGSHIDFRFRDD